MTHFDENDRDINPTDRLRDISGVEIFGEILDVPVSLYVTVSGDWAALVGAVEIKSEDRIAATTLRATTRYADAINNLIGLHGDPMTWTPFGQK